LISYQFDLAYDSLVLQVTGEEGGDGVTPGLIGSTVMPLDGWTFYDPSKLSTQQQHLQGKLRAIGHLKTRNGATGQGYLIQLHFQVVGSAGTNSKLSLSNVKLYDSSGNYLTISTQDGSVTVSAN
jgi:hypothetical protein